MKIQRSTFEARCLPNSITRVSLALFLLLFISLSDQALAVSLDPRGENVLKEKTDGKAAFKYGGPKQQVYIVSVPKGSDLMPEVPNGESKKEKSRAFLKAHGSIFGVTNADTELKFVKSRKDALDFETYTYQQEYAGIPLIGGQVKIHFDRDGKIHAASSTFIANIAVSPMPSIGSEAAESLAQSTVEVEKGALLQRRMSSKLAYFNTGVTNNVKGNDHLVYEVNVKGTSLKGLISEVVLVDAHLGNVVTRYSNIHEALNRRIYDLQGDDLSDTTFFFSIYPGSPIWTEGSPFPTPNAEANFAIPYTKWTYDLYFKLFNRDGPDFQGTAMDNAVNWDVNQFNAFNLCDDTDFGIGINQQLSVFSVGLVTDDIVAHEWSHCYHTKSTGGFVYQNQSGAVGEAFSDIVGEVVDISNVDRASFPVEETRHSQRHNITNGGERCTIVSTISGTQPVPNLLTINSPASIASEHWGGVSTFGPTLTAEGISGNIVLANDGVGTTSDGCQPLTNNVQGKIVLMDRSSACSSLTLRVKNAQNAGAIAAIIADNIPFNGRLSQFGSDASIVIPSMGVTHQVGAKLKSEMNNSPHVTLKLGPLSRPLENSYRWLQSEEPLAGIVRDLWNPHCDVDPAKVSDTDFYICSTRDNGGVHTNSTILSHAFALVVDGGYYNGQRVTPIGLDKAFPVFYRALDSYNTPTTNFSQYADNISQACQDLVGERIYSVKSFNVVSPINQQDCEQIEKAIAAVELKSTPECFQ